MGRTDVGQNRAALRPGPGDEGLVDSIWSRGVSKAEGVLRSKLLDFVRTCRTRTPVAGRAHRSNEDFVGNGLSAPGWLFPRCTSNDSREVGEYWSRNGCGSFGRR